MEVDRDHLDPEIVAAWLDGSLDAQSRADAEAHAADCARCQAVLAAMIRSEPPPTAKPWLAGATLRWLVPLTAAAAAVAIWVAVTPRESERRMTAPQANVETVPSMARAEDSAKQATIPPGTAPASPAPAPSGDQQASAVRERGAGPKPVGQIAGRQPERTMEKIEPPATGGGAVLPDSVKMQAPPPPPPVAAPLDTTAARAEARGIVARKMSVSTFAARREIRTPDGAVQWRIDPPAHLWRSSDGGKTWTPQTAGVTTELLAGSAPSPAAVWIVGRAGVVLLSTDGQTWRQVAFPESADLIGVTAVDGRSATVTTADGRSFITADGGVTWTLQLPKSQLPRAK